MKLLTKLLIATGVVTPPPASITYGATADAGEVNTSDVLVGTRYWFDATAGSDANPGTSAASPAKTLAKLYDYSISGGSLTAPRGSGFMLDRGEIWEGFLGANNNDGTFFGNYLFGAYGAGVRPTIKYKQSAALTSSNIAAAFFNRVGTLLKNVKVDCQYSFSAAATLINGTFVDGDVITGRTSGATGVFTYNNAGTFQLRCTSYPTLFTSGEIIDGPGGQYATIAAFNYAVGVVLRDQTGRTVQSCDVTNSLGIGIHLSSSGAAVGSDTVTNNIVSNCCRIQNNGAGIDGGGTSNNVYNASNLTITNNTVYDCGIGLLAHNIYLNNFGTSLISGNWSYMTSNVGNHALVIHGICDTVTIEDNLFEYCGNGLGINDGGYGNAEVFNNFTVRRNINRNHGKRSGQTQGLAMELAAMTNSAIYNNLSYGCKGIYSLAARRTSLAVLSNTVTISHETIYDCTDTFESFKVQGAVTSVVIQNCIIVCTHATSKLLNVDASAAAQVTLRNCILYAPNNAGSPISWNGTNYTIAAWLAGPGAGLGNINADPLFVDAAAGDFRLQAGSPAKLAGYNSGITTDFADNARHATTPSIGAYE